MLLQIENIMQTKSTDELKNTLSKILNQYDIPHFLYGMRIPQLNKQHKDLIINVYPLEWMQHYMKSEYIKVDSVLHYSLNNNLPVVWKDDFFTSSRQMRNESKEVGLEFGVSFPIHSITGENGIFSIASSIGKSINNETFMLVSALLPYIHEKIKDLERHNRFYPNLPIISKKELEILKWTAAGKTAFEAGCIIGVSERTVVYHLVNIMKKLNCSNKGQAVAFALTHNIIQL